MKRTLFFLIILLFVFSFGCTEEPELKPQTNCPVMGGTIDKNVYTDYQGQRIYFCCPACKPKFLDDPEKYMQKIAEDKILLESVQEFCPVMTSHELPCLINKNIHTDYKGRRVYFCSEDCKNSFLKDPEKYLKHLDEKNSSN